MLLKSKKAFTLIELLVVISIIGILTTLVFANLNAARQRARDAQRKSDMRNISTALRLYYSDNARYPATLSFGEAWELNDIEYMTLLPDDPLSPNQSYSYSYDVLEDSYQLEACLENKSDSNCDPDADLGGCTGCIFVMIP
ncbi:MAG: type II secretion system protein [Patescibacteria group bacterium]